MDHSYGHSYDDEHPWHDADGAGDWRGRKAKRKRKQRLTAVAPPTALDLTIRGNGCRITQDDNLADMIENGLHLIDYFEDRFVLSDDDESEDGDGCVAHADEDGEMTMADCLSTCKSADGDGADGKNMGNDIDKRTGCRTLYMDKYDVRMLVDDYSIIRRHGNRRHSSSHNQVDVLETISIRDKSDGLTKQQIDEINFDRFGALPEYRNIFLVDNDDNDGDGNGKSAGNSDGQDGHNKKKATEQQEAEEEPFALTEEEVKCLPKGMVLVRLLNALVLW